MSERARQILIYSVLGVAFLILIWTLIPKEEDWESMLESGSREERLEAIVKIQAWNTPEAAEILQKYIRDQDTTVAQRTLLALGRMSHADKAVLITAFEDTRPVVREAAVSSLVDHDPGYLRNLLADQNQAPAIRATCAANLGGKRDWDSMPQLILAMDDPDATVRAAAASAVRHVMGVQRFGDYSVDGDPIKRRNFVRWLYENHHGFKDVHDDFDKYLDHRNKREKG